MLGHEQARAALDAHEAQLVDEDAAALVIELAYAAGLLGADGDIDESWTPTPTYDIWREQPVATPEQYWRWLSPGCASIDVWETEYLHALQGEDAVQDWVSGTLLTPVHAVLQGRMLQDFLTAYAARLRVAYPREADGTTLFPFRRLFLVARR